MKLTMLTAKCAATFSAVGGASSTTMLTCPAAARVSAPAEAAHRRAEGSATPGSGFGRKYRTDELPKFEKSFYNEHLDVQRMSQVTLRFCWIWTILP